MKTSIRLIANRRIMKKPEIGFDLIPRSAISAVTLNICLKCSFDFFTKQLGLAPRTAYLELKKHMPEEADFTGAATERPHFFDEGDTTRCPYCNGAKSWFAAFRAHRIEAHPSFEKDRKKLWTALKKEPDRYTLWKSEATHMQIFSAWLERLKRRIEFGDDRWLIEAAIEHIRRFAPSNELEEFLAAGVSRVQSSREIKGDWMYENGRLFVSPELFGDILLVQHLLSRSHLHGGRTFVGRLTLQELTGRLRRGGYFESRGIEGQEAYELFEEAVARVVDSGPDAVYYAVDRSDYLKKLKSIYEKKREKK